MCFVFIEWERPKPLVSCPAHGRYLIRIVIKEGGREKKRKREERKRGRKGICRLSREAP